jgi:gamma-glutamylcyclotransferase (GGCT)/AIG2-like uncharacterized protein YtfP
LNKKIFVYGSLLENFYNYNKYLALKVEKKSYGRVLGKLYHLKNKGYPAMIKVNDFIYGEIFELYDWEITVASLDELEGYYGDGNPQNEYNKTLIEVEVLPEKSKELVMRICIIVKTNVNCQRKSICQRAIGEILWKNTINKKVEKRTSSM